MCVLALRYVRSTMTVTLFSALIFGGQSISLGQLARISQAQEKVAQRIDKYRYSKADRATIQKVESQMNLARSLEQQGKSAEAIYAYSTVLTYGERAEARHRLAVLYDKQGDFEKSAVHYRQALRQDPRNADVLCDRGYSFLLQGRPAEAEEDLRKAIKLRPTLARAHNNLGLVLAQQDRSDEALREFAAAGCTHAEARTNLAYALILIGDLPEAEEQLALAQQADSSLKPAGELRAAMNALMGDNRPQMAEDLTAAHLGSRPTQSRAALNAAGSSTSAPPSLSARQPLPSLADHQPSTPTSITIQKQQISSPPTNEPRRQSPYDAPIESSAVAQPQTPVVAEPEVLPVTQTHAPIVARSQPPTAADPPIPVVARSQAPVVSETKPPASEVSAPATVQAKPPVVAPPLAPIVFGTHASTVGESRPSAVAQAPSPAVTQPSAAAVAKRERAAAAQVSTPVVEEPRAPVIARSQPPVAAQSPPAVIFKPRETAQQRSAITLVQPRDGTSSRPSPVLQSEYQPIRLPTPVINDGKSAAPAAGEAIRTAVRPSLSTLRIVR